MGAFCSPPQGSFDWRVAESASSLGLWPDTVSTDLHSGNVRGAVKDLPHVMSKMLSLGMPLKKVTDREIRKKPTFFQPSTLQ